MSDSLGVETAGGVATLTLNRPDKLNAFDEALLGALAAALKQAARDAAVRCIVITGAGRAFSAGQDLGAVRARAEGDAAATGGMSFRAHLEQGYNPVIRAIRSVEKPVVAAVNGVAAGAGASLALACDLRLASERASFIQSFVNVGLVPDSGSTWFLPQMLGFARAFELAVTAERLSAADALSLGLVNRVYPEDRFQAEVAAYAADLAARPTRAIGLTKRAMNRAPGLSLDQALAYEAQLQEIAGRSADHGEGLAAFLEKRTPRFSGR